MIRGDRRSERIRKPSAKAADMQNIRQQSNIAIELAFLAASYDGIDIPTTLEKALNTPQADKWLEAYESEMKSLIEHGTFSGPLDKIPHNKSAVQQRLSWT